MDKQDFNHFRRLFAEIFQKDETIKQLKDTLSKCDAHNNELVTQIHDLKYQVTSHCNRASQFEDASLNNLSLYESVKRECNSLAEQVRSLKEQLNQATDIVLNGPMLSDQEILDQVVAEFGEKILNREGGKITAIKRAKELGRGRLGLREAKDLVEDYIKAAENALKIIRDEYPDLGRDVNISSALKDRLIDKFMDLTNVGHIAARKAIEGMWELNSPIF